MEQGLPEDSFKILIATDNHLGYGEKKPVIDQDSYRAFEEILQIASQREVDFILLGGDLFHESQPSPYCIYKCTELLRKYCLGDKPVSIEFLSDQCDNFKHLKNPVVNYEDPNLNVSIPVFSIHGNHDNPAGMKQISALDILSTAGLVNYFGRWTDLSEVEVRPILLKKGQTHLALYGLSHIPDHRLARLFKDKRVFMPKVELGEWFNLLVLHQNRANRGVKNFIPSSVIPSFIDLVIWGHEHDCRITPEEQVDGLHISQPGSSVITSLSEGEAYEKHVGILTVYKTMFKMEAVPLKTVRPFIYSNFELIDPETVEYDVNNPVQQSLKLVKEEIDQMISKAAERHKDPTAPPQLPFIRVNVKYYTEVQTFNPIRLGHEYEDKVANPADIIKISKLRPERRESRHRGDESEDLDNIEEWATRVEDVVQKYFENQSEKHQMSVLSVKGMLTALSRFIDKADSEAVNYTYDIQKKNTLEKLVDKDPKVEDIDALLKQIKEKGLLEEDKEVEQIQKALDDENRAVNQPEDPDEINVASSDDDAPTVPVEKPARGRGSRAGRGSRGGRGSRARASRSRASPRSD